MTRDEAIAEYMEYAQAQGRYWASRFPFLRDDILAVAMFALVEAFDKRIPEKAKGYLSTCIRNAVNDLLEKNNLIHIPRSERQRRKAEKIPLDSLPKALLMGDEELWDLRVARDFPVWMFLQYSDVAILLGLDDREKEIIRLKSEGYTNEEVGFEFEVSEAAIRKILKNLQGRYLVTMRDHPEMLRPNEQP